MLPYGVTCYTIIKSMCQILFFEMVWWSYWVYSWVNLMKILMWRRMMSDCNLASSLWSCWFLICLESQESQEAFWCWYAGFNLTFKILFVSFFNKNDCAKLILNTAHHGCGMKKIFLSRLFKTSELYLVPEDFCKKGLF